MLDLTQSLKGRDLGHLYIVGELWGLELHAPDARSGLQQLVLFLLDRHNAEETIEVLPSEARAALDDLLQNQGRLPWTLFTRRYGAVREMGPGRRDREHPYLNPDSAAEVLWYRALVARAFLDTATGPQEFAFVPTDLLALIPAAQEPSGGPLGRQAYPRERAHLLLASDRILDHACSLLAALRVELPAETIDTNAASWSVTQASTQPSLPYPLSPIALQHLLTAADILDAGGRPKPEPTRAFLEAPRGEALAQLASAWLGSTTYNELRLLPGLRADGEWQNDPLHARQAVIGFLSSVPGDTWWSLPAFVEAVRKTHPDFQRPAGDYDSWYIRDQRTGEFLRGFEHWDEVDGALIRYSITGPLHWLGIMDLAAPAEGEPAAAFRYSNWASDLLNGSAPQGLPVEDGSLLVNTDACVKAPRLVPRAVRFQIARASAWEGEKDEVYFYRLTPGSLDSAREQGLLPKHLLTLLRSHTEAVPPSLVSALKRWDEYGVEARLERVLVLRLSNPELLQALRSSRAARFLGNILGPTAVVVKPGAWKKVMGVLAEMGYLGDAGQE